LARIAVLEAIPTHRRIQWHGRVLAALRSGPMNVDDLARLAFHAEEAEDEAAVLVYAPRAAAHASALGAHREAAAQYARALRHAEGLPPEQRATLLEGHSLECILTSQLAEAIASRRTAVELRRALGDRLREGDNLRWLSYVLWPAGHDGEARKSGLAAVQVLEGLEPSRELAWAYVNLCQLATYDYAGVAGAAAYAEQAVALGERFGDPGVIVQARFHAAAARLLCTGSGWDECEQAVDSAIAQDLRVDAGLLASLMCWFAVLQRDGGRTAAAVERAEAYYLDHDLLSCLFAVRVSSSWGLLGRGLWAQAAETAQAILSHPSPPPCARALALTVLGLVRARRGDPRVWPLLDEAAGLVEPGAVIASGPGWEARAEAAWLAGDDDRAQAEAAHGLAALGDRLNPWLTGALACWIHRAGGVPPTVLASEPYALELAGDWAAAAEAWEARGFPYEAALARLGGNAEAVAQALATFESLDADPATARARALLRATGQPIPRRGRGSTPVPARLRRLGVTSREADVLALLAQGLSNRQIAARLFLSPRTVEKHIEHLMAKTNSANRAALATYASLLDTPTR
ncbi:MAG TPA: LuxR C-terminal-related transcriptional regulator, partial [Pseudonocardiaceae bacterium]|nr:LuxR C-terminal-related transcriptional regulator [Pseudonocardiaceae bacterium]